MTAVLKCSNCGVDRMMTNESVYEATRLGKTLCRTCARKLGRRKGSKYDALVKKGDIFGKLTIISDKVSESGAYVICKCECGTITQVIVKKLLDTSRYQACKKCKTGKNSSNWKGISDVPMSVFTKIKLRAQYRNKQFSIKPEYIADLYAKQNGKCALSGLPLTFAEEGKNLSDSTSIIASLDRIDSSIGYVEGNVQWVHKHINSMKNEYTIEYFINLCKEVVKHNDKDRNRRNRTSFSDAE